MTRDGIGISYYLNEDEDEEKYIEINDYRYEKATGEEIATWIAKKIGVEFCDITILFVHAL